MKHPPQSTSSGSSIAPSPPPLDLTPPPLDLTPPIRSIESRAFQLGFGAERQRRERFNYSSLLDLQNQVEDLTTDPSQSERRVTKRE